MADAEKKTAKDYGVLSLRGFANRATFVIDKKGVIRKVYSSQVDPKKNAEEVLDWINDNLKHK